MKILVTGGAGYLGSMLVPQLLNAGYKVTVIDNFRYGQTPLLGDIFDDSLIVVNEDLLESRVDYGAFDFVVHLACITGAPACDKNPALAERVNLGLVRRLVESNAKRIVFPCTNSGYGIGQEGIECDETTSLKPVSWYGKLKVEAESLVTRWGGASLRFATLFGISPRMRMDLLVNDFVYRALTDRFLVLFEQHYKRNYLHVIDAARSILFAIANYEKMAGQSFNVGLSDANLSKLELAQKIKEHLPDTELISSEVGKDIDKRNYIVSNKKVEALGYGPVFSLDGGIKELIRGYQIIKKNEYTNL